MKTTRAVENAHSGKRTGIHFLFLKMDLIKNTEGMDCYAERAENTLLVRSPPPPPPLPAHHPTSCVHIILNPPRVSHNKSRTRYERRGIMRGRAATPDPTFWYRERVFEVLNPDPDSRHRLKNDDNFCTGLSKLNVWNCTHLKRFRYIIIIINIVNVLYAYMYRHGKTCFMV